MARPHKGEAFLLIRTMGKRWENKSVNNILARPHKTDGKHRCLVISTMGQPWEKTSHTKQRFQTNQIQVTFILSICIKNFPVFFFIGMGNSCPESPRQLLAVAPIYILLFIYVLIYICGGPHILTSF